MTPCCAHRGLDHAHQGGGPRAGTRCTFPDCPCRGWVPRTATSGKRPSGMSARILTLHEEGLDAAEIRERLGVSSSRVRSALRGAQRRQPPRSASRRGKRATAADCLSGFGR